MDVDGIDVETIAKRAIQARRELDPPKSWREIAKESGVAFRTIQDLIHRLSVEDGRQRKTRGPTLDTLARLARALGVPASWLAFGDEGRQDAA